MRPFCTVTRPRCLPPFSLAFSACSCALVFRQHKMLPNESLKQPNRTRMAPKKPTKPSTPMDSSVRRRRRTAMEPPGT